MTLNASLYRLLLLSPLLRGFDLRPTRSIMVNISNRKLSISLAKATSDQKYRQRAASLQMTATPQNFVKKNSILFYYLEISAPKPNNVDYCQVSPVWLVISFAERITDHP